MRPSSRQTPATGWWLFIAFLLTTALGVPAGLRAQADSSRAAVITSVTTAGVEYTYSNFQGEIDPWHLIALTVGHKAQAGTLIGRVNIANQFATWGEQYEVDAYPALWSKAYGYLNAGYSQSAIYPEWRFGSEIFQTLPHATEASVGFRQLRFASPVTLYTGSVGLYKGNYWFSLRPYLQDRAADLSISASLTARRYYADADNYIGARVGGGRSPTDDITASQLTRTNSFIIAIMGSRNASTHTIGTWSFSYEREDLVLDRIRNRWEASGGLKYRFH